MSFLGRQRSDSVLSSTTRTIDPPPPSKMSNRVRQSARLKRSRSNSRRFIVTDLPHDAGDWYHSDVSHDDDEEDNDSVNNQSETASISSSDDVSGDCHLPSTPLTRQHSQPTKTEVRGRFTIIDLSPELPQPASSSTEASTPHPDNRSAVSTRRPVRALPRRRAEATQGSITPELYQPPRSPLHGNVLDMGRTPLHQHTRHALHIQTDLNAFDRHLEYLQQESSNMKTLLESMVSSNSRWIEALGNTTSSCEYGTQRGKKPVFQHHEEQHTAKPKIEESQSKLTSPHPKAPPPRPPSPYVLTTIDDPLITLQNAYRELDLKYEALMQQNTQIERNNIMLETRLRQEMTLNDELRAHVDQLTQYTESLLLASDYISGCDDKELANECLEKQALSKSRRRRRSVISANEDSHMLPSPPPSAASSSNQTAPISNSSLNQLDAGWPFGHRHFGGNQSFVDCDDPVEGGSEGEVDHDVHSDILSQSDDCEVWTLASSLRQMIVTTQGASNQLGEVSVLQERRPSFPSHSYVTCSTTSLAVAKQSPPEKPICLRRGTPSPEKSTLSLLASPNTVFRQIRHAPR